MQHANMRRELGDCLSYVLKSDPADLPQPPRPYQREAIKSVAEWLSDPSGPPRAHVVHATGLGKTVLFSLLAHAALGLRILVVVPTQVLLEQTVRCLSRAAGGIIGQISGIIRVENDEGEVLAVQGHENHDIVVVTNASFLRRRYSLANHYRPHLIVWDECHTAYSRAYQGALEAFGSTPVLGLTATPDYLSATDLPGFEAVTLENGSVLYGTPAGFAATHFGQKLDHRSLRWGIENRWLAPLTWGCVDFDQDLQRVPVGPSTDGGQDYKLPALQHAMSRGWQKLTEAIISLYRSGEYDLSRRQVFAACPGIVAAQSLAQALMKAGVSAACVASHSTKAERRETLKGFVHGRISFISSVVILREGWDAPNAEVCMMLRPTKSRLLYEQYLGRAMRMLPDGRAKTATVIDVLFPHTDSLGPLTAPMLFGDPASPIKRGDILIAPQ